ncbi:BTB/POZ domain-containing protein 2-like [Condylostylus longicornis]|uniref:BTB/POZ domain-containing protein 2-like n=1 Tax=Condylostylus longicornis TaxID=2530218 RepID=UPI00244DA311|nr:BTB/POZ domain-containing protein 2-like [Condylostylus longicornis]
MDESSEDQTSSNGLCREFLVGSEGEQASFSLNKLLLAEASPLFQRLFYGSTADKSDVILVPDVTPRAFSAMVNFIYTDTLNIKSIEDAFEQYIVAIKFHSFLRRDCKDMFPKLIKEIIIHPNFMEIKLSTLREILSMDNLMISEVELFIALRNYVYVNDYLVELNENNKKQDQLQNTQEVEINQSDDVAVQNTQRNIEDLKYAILAKSGLLSESNALAILINIISSSNTICRMPGGFSVSKNPRYSPSLIQRLFSNLPN